MKNTSFPTTVRSRGELLTVPGLMSFSRYVPAAVPGIAFLSGGQSDVEATDHLSAMNRLGPHPWELTYSYGRGLQAAPQKAWSGKAENISAAQMAFEERGRANAAAREGLYVA